MLSSVRFSHGSIDVKKDQSKMSWQLYKRKLASSSREKKESILAAEIDGMSYTARNFAKDQTDDMCDYYMGVIDEETDKMRVFPADFFTMQPVIEDTDAAENKATNRDWRAKTDDLVKEFGSGRMQRAVNKRQKNKLDDEMLSTVTQAVANTSVLEQQSSQEGKGPSGIYPLLLTFIYFEVYSILGNMFIFLKYLYTYLDYLQAQFINIFCLKFRKSYLQEQ